MSDKVTPKEVADVVGVDEKTVRAFLRENYGTLPDDVTRWDLTARQVLEVVDRFLKNR